ncbi:MAG TPA: ferredoxin [Chitinophagaceae bacterium]|nr:ferredoxin [Chitinophagaceae bacterium]
MPKIIHYRNKCIGCGVCYEQQPELWRMSKKDGKATLINSEQKNDISILKIIPASLHKSKQIAAACPVRIIKIS